MVLVSCIIPVEKNTLDNGRMEMLKEWEFFILRREENTQENGKKVGHMDSVLSMIDMNGLFSPVNGRMEKNRKKRYESGLVSYRLVINYLNY